jgi:hypothetical protein
MLKNFHRAFMFMMDEEHDPVVRMVEVEYSKEFNHLQRALGRRPSRKDIEYILSN